MIHMFMVFSVYKISSIVAHFELEIDQCEIIEVIMMVTLRHVNED